ncbi:MAG TPA: PAS-domain containing protein [Paracoccaceae bacterium]|nr:PAS-domain containing protein [Paracoccaceae bacterium]
MSHSILNPADTVELQNRKLIQIVDVLMRRVEQATDDQGAAYTQFQRAVLLEDQVRTRTRELEKALDLLNQSNALLSATMREAEAARQNLANAIETVQEGFALFDPADRLVLCNSRFGLPLQDVHPHLLPGLAFGEYVTLASQSADLVRALGEGPEDWARARLRRHADRHVILTVELTGDRWLQVSEQRTRDEGTVVIQTDVTDIIRLERKERGKLLDDQARMIRATLDHISQGVGIFDASCQLVGWNNRLADLLAIPVQRLQLGLPFSAILGSFGGHLRLGGDLTLRGLSDWVFAVTPRPALSFELLRADGYVLAAFAQEMPDRGFVMSFTDITPERSARRALSDANETLEARVAARTDELARALDEAERANASRTRFVAAASHDLLQPLSAAKLFLASISDETLGGQGRTALQKAQKALTSVEDILGALLDISKLESGRAAVDVGPVRLGPILDQLRDEFAPLAALKGLRLSVVPSSVQVESDATYLRRILQNLIGNAIRYTMAGRVLVGVRRLPGAIRIEVVDTGPGIPEGERQTIFREFHRLNAPASASEGMGLGLAIVERACLLLGHPLELRSDLDRGTSFMVTVPLAGFDGTPLTATQTAEGPFATSPAGRIVLLVENDDDLRRALCLLLEKWQLSVIDVATAEEALTLLDDIGIVPDRFLIDLQLGPGMDGVGLIRVLRARYGEIAASILTAQRQDDLRLRDPDVPVLRKPIDVKELAVFLTK